MDFIQNVLKEKEVDLIEIVDPKDVIVIYRLFKEECLEISEEEMNETVYVYAG
jgi:hypothetical protein